MSLARALVFNPPVLLMDECLSALDLKLREQLHALKPVGFSRSGRSAFGRVVAALLLGCVLMAGIFWWKQSSDAEAFRDGVRNGWVAARTGI